MSVATGEQTIHMLDCALSPESDTNNYCDEEVVNDHHFFDCFTSYRFSTLWFFSISSKNFNPAILCHVVPKVLFTGRVPWLSMCSVVPLYRLTFSCRSARLPQSLRSQCAGHTACSEQHQGRTVTGNCMSLSHFTF